MYLQLNKLRNSIICFFKSITFFYQGFEIKIKKCDRTFARPGRYKVTISYFIVTCNSCFFVMCYFFIILFRTLVSMTYNKETSEIARPSELLSKMNAYMAVLQSIENYVHLGKFKFFQFFNKVQFILIFFADVTRIFNSVLLQQSQMLDSHGETTITTLYTQW